MVMKMHKKKYFTLIPPTLLIGLLLLYYIPASQRPYVLFVPIVMWTFYYTWIHIEKNKKKKHD